jgi:DHA2 family metal-tetracycline-proton antiporter-like MFS transporter
MNDKIVMPIWTVGLFIIVMNTTMFNVSIPSIIGDLGISADLGSWIISSYSIGYALSTVIYSRLSDVVQIRKLLAVGLTVLGLSSIFGIFARDFQSLLTARILQSAGAGAMTGLGLVIASRYVPFEKRGGAIAMISAGSAMAFGFGPIIGGLITQYFGWNGLFAVTCLVLVPLPLLWRLLPKEQPKAFRFDVLGAILTTCNAATLLLAVTQRSAIWLAVSALSFVAHAWHLKKAKEPFIGPELVTKSAYWKLFAVGFCILVLNIANLFLMPLALASLFHQSAMAIGFMIAPGAILTVFLSRFVGRWIDQYGNVRFLIIGHAILAVVMAFFTVDLAASPVIILMGYLCFSPAVSAMIASLNNEMIRILPKTLIGAGMGLMQLIQFFGGSLSVAVCGLILAIEKDIPLVNVYKHIYGMLFLISICSLLVVLGYRRSANKELLNNL